MGPTEHNVHPSNKLHVSYVKPHPELERNDLTNYWMANQNDFVLLHLETPIPSEFLKPVCLPEATTWKELWSIIFTPTATSLVGGWKRARDLDPTTNELVIHSFELCESLWKAESDTMNYDFSNRICAFPTADPTMYNPNRECFPKDSGVILRHPNRKRYFLGFINTYFPFESFCGPKANHTISLATPSVLAWVRQNIACGSFNYTCHDGECVPLEEICDRKPGCTDESDEDEKYCRGRNYCNPKTEFECGTYGPCIPIQSGSGKLAATCDEVKDCPDGEDEANCIQFSDPSGDMKWHLSKLQSSNSYDLYTLVS